MDNEKKPVLVSTNQKFLFFGYTTQKDPASDLVVYLSDVRLVISWSSDVMGLVGLASTGPTSSCKLSKIAPAIAIKDAAFILNCTKESANEFKKL